MLIFQDICNICTESKHTLPKSSPREKQYELPDRSAQELIRNDDQRVGESNLRTCFEFEGIWARNGQDIANSLAVCTRSKRYANDVMNGGCFPVFSHV